MSSCLTFSGFRGYWSGVKNFPPPELFARELLNAGRLADALTLLASEHAAQHRLSEAAVVGAFSWVIGRIVGASARDGRRDLDQLLGVLGQQVRCAAVGEMARRAYTLH